MAKSKAPQMRIGISGWTYAPWRGVFYPAELPQTQELPYASRMLNSIEINGTFYSLQRPTSFQTWYDATPDDAVFSVKGPRFITHIRRLRDVAQPLANFLASGLLGLKDKLGPILWQFPPNFKFDRERFEAFFRLLPRDTSAAAEMAKAQDGRIKGTPVTETDATRPMRYAIEIRNPSFETPEFIDLLREHNIALVFADTGGKWSWSEDVTADFIYARLHGDEELYASGYTPEALDRWAERLRTWADGKEPADAAHWSTQRARSRKRDLFVYFDNDVKVKAPYDAMSLAQRLGPAAQGESVLGKDAPPQSPKLTRKALAERVRSHWPAPVKRRPGTPPRAGNTPQGG